MLERARAAGLTHIVVIGESIPGSERATALAQGRPGLSATAGVHPHEAASWSAESRARIHELVRDPVVVAVGETGLDYHYDHAPRERQRAAFEEHLQLAADCGKPVVVHAREADSDMAAMLRALGPRPPVVVLHSFASGDDVWEAGMAVNAYFSFSGMITFKNWTQGARVAACPADRLLVETDAPYLAPVPHRGRRNEPAFVAAVAARAAELRNETPATLAQQSADNARRCFGPRLAIAL